MKRISVVVWFHYTFYTPFKTQNKNKLNIFLKSIFNKKLSEKNNDILFFLLICLFAFLKFYLYFNIKY